MAARTTRPGATPAKPRARKTSGTRRPTRPAATPTLEIAALSLGALAVAAGVAMVGMFAFRRITAADEGHAAPDLLGSTRPGPGDRAPPAFRPDMAAPMTAAEREALRPATGPAPSMVSGGFLPNGIGAR